MRELNRKISRPLVVVVQLPSHVWLFATPWTAACQLSLSFTISRSLLQLISIKSVMLSNHLIFCCPLFLLPSVFPSIRVFPNESTLPVRWPKYWSFNINPSHEYSGLISFRVDWFELLAVQETLKSLLQCHNLKASTLWHSAFFMVQLSHLHIATGKTIALTIWTFAGKVLYNKLSRFVIAFLPKNKCLLISWLPSPSVVILGIEENKACHFFPINLPWSGGTGCYDFCILNVEI